MDQPLGLGKSSAKGERGITKRLDALARQTPLRGDRLLDIGCGDGAYTVRLAESFGQVEAIDIQQDRLALFAERIAGTGLADRVTVREMSATALDYPDATFDLITAIEVVEHVTELPGALAEIHRVLRPGGRFCVTTPNRWFPFETHGVLVRGRRYPSSRAPFVTWVRPVHRRFSDARTFTAAELRGHLAQAGLRLRSLDYMMPPFDRSGVGRRIRAATDRIERSPLSFFGMTLIATAEKDR